MRIIKMIVFISAMATTHSYAENLRVIVNLEGTWKFSVGDDMRWASPDYDDNTWDYVQVPKRWEDNGFDGYNGYAWYRKSFRFEQVSENRFIYLLAGYIDDVDEVYLNGELIGKSGKFPPQVETAYDVPRKYPLPVHLLKQDEMNVIAIRVFDDYLNGGIVAGKIGLYYDEDNNYLDQDLSGYWDYEISDPGGFYRDGQDVATDQKLFVPAYWDIQGLQQYDGSVTYKTSFVLADGLKSAENLYMILGYIDDIEQVFINRRKIGSVKDITRDESAYHATFRAYEIPDELLNRSGVNTIEVIVDDMRGLGGIYAGPVGIVTYDNFKRLKDRQLEKRENFFYELFKNFWE